MPVEFLPFAEVRKTTPTYFVYQTPLGRVSIQARDQAITQMRLGSCQLDGQNKSTAATNAVATQVQEYLAGKRTEFDLTAAAQGTDFQVEVWQQLCRIAYGQTMSYSQVAEAIGKPKAYRAVGAAANSNPILLAIPCHRVVGSDGSLVGFASGLHIKRYLLDLEAGKL